MYRFKMLKKIILSSRLNCEKKERFTLFVEVIDKLQFDTNYHFDILIPFRKDIEVKRWNVQVVLLDVCNTFRN